MKKAIVTGANGFVGYWLVNELVQNGYHVIAVARSERHEFEPCVEKVICDINQTEQLKKFLETKEVDIFIHLAWEGSGGSLRGDYHTQLDNVRSACNMAKLAKEIGVKHFYSAGTITENIVDDIILHENVSQNMMYAVSKKYARIMLDIYCRMLDMKFTWLQFSNVYGPYNNSGNLLSYALSKMDNNEEPEFSAGSQPYDFIYVKDLVKAIRMLCDNECERRIYFLGSGQSRLLREYLLELPVIYGGNSSVGVGKRPEDGIKYDMEWFDISDLISDTGFKASYTFAEGLKETILTNRKMEEKR